WPPGGTAPWAFGPWSASGWATPGCGPGVSRRHTLWPHRRTSSPTCTGSEATRPGRSTSSATSPGITNPRRSTQLPPPTSRRWPALPAGAGARRGVGHAPAPGALPPRPRDAVWRDGPAGAGPHRVVHGQRDVPRYGDDVLAA